MTFISHLSSWLRVTWMHQSLDPPEISTDGKYFCLWGEISPSLYSCSSQNTPMLLLKERSHPGIAWGRELEVCSGRVEAHQKLTLFHAQKSLCCIQALVFVFLFLSLSYFQSTVTASFLLTRYP